MKHPTSNRLDGTPPDYEVPADAERKFLEQLDEQKAAVERIFADARHYLLNWLKTASPEEKDEMRDWLRCRAEAREAGTTDQSEPTTLEEGLAAVIQTMSGLAVSVASENTEPANRTHAELTEPKFDYSTASSTAEIRAYFGAVRRQNQWRGQTEARRANGLHRTRTRGASRESRPGTSRTQGSRRSGTGTSGSSSDPDEGGDADPPGLRVDTGKGEKDPRTCAGCDAPIDADRNADATLCPPPKKTACWRATKKRAEAEALEDSDALLALRASTRRSPDPKLPQRPLDTERFKPSPTGRSLLDAAMAEADDARAEVSACQLAGEHPESFGRLTRRVRHALKAGRKAEAAGLVRTWLTRLDSDPLTGVLVCRGCRAPVRTPEVGVTKLTRLFGTPTDAEFEMQTDAEGQRLDYRAPKREWTLADHRRAAGSRPRHEWALLDGEVAA